MLVEPKVGGHFVTTASVSFAGTQGFTYSSDNIGADTFFYVSGSKTVSGSSDRWEGTAPRAVSVFGGDLVVSGTLYAERQVIEVDETTPGDFLVSGSLIVSRRLPEQTSHIRKVPLTSPVIKKLSSMEKLRHNPFSPSFKVCFFSNDSNFFS